MKYIKKFLTFVLTFSLCIVPTFAAEYQTGVYANVKYSESITPKDNDVFELKVCNSLASSEEELKEKSTVIKINAKKATEEMVICDLEPGTYYVYGINYLGSNKEIISEGFAFSNSFDVSAYENTFYGLNISIGDKEAKKLCSEANINVYKNNEYLDSDEFIYDTKKSTNNEGKIPPMAQLEEDDDEPENEIEYPKEDSEKKEKKENEKKKKKKQNGWMKFLNALVVFGIVSGAGFIVYLKKSKQ